MIKNTKFNWTCIHCGAKNITPLKFQFDVPHEYGAHWGCGKCGKETYIEFSFTTDFPRKEKNV